MERQGWGDEVRLLVVLSKRVNAVESTAKPFADGWHEVDPFRLLLEHDTMMAPLFHHHGWGDLLVASSQPSVRGKMAGSIIKEILMLVAVHRAIMPVHHACKVQTAVSGGRNFFRRGLRVLEGLVGLTGDCDDLVLQVLVLPRVTSGESGVLWVDPPTMVAMGQLVWVGIEAEPTKWVGGCIILECQNQLEFAGVLLIFFTLEGAEGHLQGTPNKQCN